MHYVTFGHAHTYGASGAVPWEDIRIIYEMLDRLALPRAERLRAFIAKSNWRRDDYLNGSNWAVSMEAAVALPTIPEEGNLVQLPAPVVVASSDTQASMPHRRGLNIIACSCISAGIASCLTIAGHGRVPAHSDVGVGWLDAHPSPLLAVFVSPGPAAPPCMLTPTCRAKLEAQRRTNQLCSKLLARNTPA